MDLYARLFSLPNSATRSMSPMIDHYVLRTCAACTEPAGPAELRAVLGLATVGQVSAGNLDVAQKQSYLPRPLVVRVEPHERIQLREATRTRQKVAEPGARQRPKHDLETVLALP